MNRRGEIGYWTHPAARARGLMTEAVAMPTRYAEDHGLTDSLLIRCAATNRASRHVAESAGYRQVGILAHAERVGGSGQRKPLLLAANCLPLGHPKRVQGLSP
jgi:RimJ/RimL family protein N-acetyltransferase